MKTETKKKIIYFRYILPVILLLIAFAISFVPSYRYVVEGALEDKQSAFDIVCGSLDTSRNVLFGTGESDSPNVVAARIILTMLAVGFIGVVISLAVSIYSLVMSMNYFMSDDEEKTEKQRVLFVTLLPNRIVLCALELLAFLSFAFPYVLPAVYENIYGQRVTLAVISIDPMAFAVVGFLALIVLSFVCAPMERSFGADLFKKIKPTVETLEQDEDEEEEDERVELSQEQNEFIRSLLKNREKTIDSEMAEEDTDGDE